MPKAKRSFLDGLIDTLASTAATELSERLPGVTAKGKATARRHMRKQLRESMQSGATKISNAAKKVKEKVTARSERKPRKFEDSVASLQFHTACAVLGLGNRKYGKPIDEEKIREAKHAAARLFHPDVNGGNEEKREQLQAVLDAAEWLEKYNANLKRDRP